MGDLDSVGLLALLLISRPHLNLPSECKNGRAFRQREGLRLPRCSVPGVPSDSSVLNASFRYHACGKSQMRKRWEPASFSPSDFF